MEDSIPRKRSPRWLLALTLVLAAGLLFLALRKVNWAELAATLLRADPLRLGLALVILTVACVLRGLRWRVLLSAEKTLPISTVFWATMTGYLGNAYLPARAGEVVRSVLVGQKGGISKSFALATALTERIVDAVILVTVSALALTTLPTLPPQLLQALKGMAAVGVIGAAAVFLAPRMGGWINTLILRLPLLSLPLKTKISAIAAEFLTGAGALQHGGRLAQFLLYSAVIWSIDTLNGLVIASAFGITLQPAQVFILLAALGLASALPSTPGYVGVYQFVAVTVLVPFGLSQAQALAMIIAYQGVQYIVVSLWGLIGLWKLRQGFKF